MQKQIEPTQADIDLAALQLMGFMDLGYFAEPVNNDFEMKGENNDEQIYDTN
jgi:hypothetical protein